MKLGSDVTHAILTRFNVARPKQQDPIRLDPDWLARRFDLFERYCLPSVAAQTARDFHWIVYFDEATPPAFRARIEACRAVFAFTPFFTPVIDAAGWPASLAEVIPARTPWLVTTRFDNDDALAVDYVERLHAALARQSAPARGSFNFARGFVLEGGRAYALRHPSNAFASWLEPWDEAARTAVSIHHMRLAEHGTVTQIDGPGAWLQVVHGGNISNKVRGWRTGPAALRGRFPPDVLGPLDPVSPLSRGLENLAVTPLRAGRDAALALLRRRG